MKFCRCERPRAGRNPDFCGVCLVRHDSRTISSDKNLRTFMVRLAKLPDVTGEGLTHAQRREKAGRTAFGLEYLSRDNDAEGQEEAADGIAYAYLSWLKDRREGTEEIDPELLDAAHHFALAHAALERRRK